MSVNVAVTPSVSIAITSGVNPTCSGSSVTFTATPTNGGTPSYQWKKGTTVVGTNSPTYTDAGTTGGSITCIMTSSLTCVTSSTATSNAIALSVTSTLTPSVSIAITSGVNPTCSGSNVTFTATPTNGGTPSYQWKKGTTVVGTNSPIYTDAGTTGGSITCVMTSSLTCVTSSTATSNAIALSVTSTLTPTVSIAITSGVNPTCSGSSVTFTATPANGGTPSYQWKKGTTVVGTNSPTYTDAGTTAGSITCVMTSSLTCVTSSTATSNAIALSVTSTLTPSVSIAITSGVNPTCSGSSVTFTATPANGGTASYQWKKGTTVVGTNSATYTDAGTTAGSITCVMTSSLTCVTSSTATSNAIALSVTSTLTPSVSIAITSGVNPTCSGSSVTFTATPTNGGTPSYQWKKGTTVVGTNSSTYTDAGTTAGSITCVMTSSLTCVTSSTATSNAIALSVTSTLTPSVSIAITSGVNPTCSGSSVTFTATPTNGGTPSYQWKKGTTVVGTNSSTYTDAGTTAGSITCVMTSSLTCVTSSTATSNAIALSVTSTLTPSVSIAITSGVNPTCSGSSVTFTATPTNGGTPSYQWKKGTTVVGTNSPTYTDAGTTAGSITCVMTSSLTCVTSSTANSNAIALSVTTPLTPSVSIAITSGVNPTCSGSSVTFTASPANGGTASYQWKKGTTVVGTNSPTYTDAGTTAGSITCIMTSSHTCVTSSTATSNAIALSVTSKLTPSVSIAITSGVNPTCSGSSVTFTATPTNGGAASYQWKKGTTVVGTNSATYTDAGTTAGSITCVMTSSHTCVTSSTATSNAIALSVTTPLTPSVSIAITSGVNPTCSGSSVTFTATPTNGGAASYQWKKGTTVVGTNSATYTDAGTTAGSITCVMTSSHTCVTSSTATSNVIALSVTTPLTPSVSIAITSGANPTCSGSSVTFTASPTNGGSASYQWKKGTTVVGTNSATYTDAGTTAGSITCVMTSSHTCVTSSTATSNAIALSVTSKLTPSVSIAITSGANPTCSGSSVTFTATPTNGGAASYQWKKGTTLVGTNSPTYTDAGTTAGSITCVMTSSHTCVTSSTATSNAIALSVSSLPAAPTVTTTQPTCSVPTGTIRVTAPLGGFTYSVNGTTYQSSPTFGGLAPNTYTVTVKNSSGCVSTGTSATLNAATVPTAPVVGNITQPTCQTPTGSVALSGLPLSGTWTLTQAPGNVTTTGTGTNTTISGLAPGSYTFRVTNAAGCQSSASSAVVITTTPAAPAAFTLTGSMICSNSPGTGTVRLSSSQNGVSYQLRIGNINVQSVKFGNGSAITWTALAAGNGYYVVASRSGCTSQTNTTNVTSVAAPSATIVYTGSPYCKFTSGMATVTRTGQVGGKYTASPGGLSLNSTTGTINLLFSQAGTYTVTYTFNNESCTNTTTTVVRLNNCFADVTNGNGPVINPKIGTPIGPEMTINVRPVPTETFFTLTVKSSSQQTVEINVYDVTGRKIQQLRGSALDSYHFGDMYVPGAYFVEVLQGSQRVTQKILKQ